MTQQFTASEVVKKLRERFASGNDVPVPDVRLTRTEFDVVADLLEAQERAVPAAWLRDSGVDIESEAACVTNTVRNLWLASNPKRIERYTIPLYTHPAPSDAERLAEAVRNGLIDALRHQRQIDEDGAEVGVSRQAIDEAAAILSALAAHPAPAQPPAASVPDGQCTWVEDDDGNWETGCGNMFVLNDGTPYDNKMGFCCYCGHKLDQITQEIAAQENSNE